MFLGWGIKNKQCLYSRLPSEIPCTTCGSRREECVHRSERRRLRPSLSTRTADTNSAALARERRWWISGWKWHLENFEELYIQFLTKWKQLLNLTEYKSSFYRCERSCKLQKRLQKCKKKKTQKRPDNRRFFFFLSVSANTLFFVAICRFCTKEIAETKVCELAVHGCFQHVHL